MEHRFHLKGWITPQEVIQWFPAAIFCFMPSLSEGLPVTGVQGLAMGLAVVASDIGGFKDVVEPGLNGFLVPVDQPTDMNRHSAVLLTDPELLLANRKASSSDGRKF
jgi:glycosyltransferase involved in cell wall biosynthesis